MLRDINSLANATPPDYLAAIPKNPTELALQLIAKARQLFPINQAEDGVAREQNYTFLFVGPGSGQIIQVLLDQRQRAFGIESSRKGIMSAPDEVRGYISWVKPWENNFPSMRSSEGSDRPAPFRMFHIALINKFLKTYYTPEEWNSTVNEVKKLARYAAVI